MRKYPRLYIWKEKHGDRYCQVNSENGENQMFLDIAKERLEEGWYEEEKGIRQAIESSNFKGINTFISKRRNYEYEDFEIDSPKIYE